MTIMESLRAKELDWYLSVASAFALLSAIIIFMYYTYKITMSFIK